MSPLFRGLGGIGEEHGEMAELMPATSTGRFTAEDIDCDDSLSDSLSNYQFDITGHDLIPEPTNAPKAKLSEEQSSTPTHPRSLMAPDKPLKPKASQLFPPPPPRDPSPSPEHFPPSVPPKPTRPIVPMKSGTTRPLKIDRSRKRTGPSVTSQRTSGAEAQNVATTSKPISRATTHVNLRDAYRRDRLLAERKVPTRGATPAMPSYPRPHAETPDRNVTQVNTQPSPDAFCIVPILPTSQQIPIATLFPSGLIPLDRAQDKFKHAHCLDRLPPQPDVTDSSTLSSGNHGRGWSFSRAFKKQKA